MKRIALAISALLALVVSVAGAAPKTFVIDKSHSEVGFNVRHFFNKVHGRFNDYTASIVFDPENVATSTLDVTIRDSSIYTANDNRDKHLRTEDFFWTEKYPTITFKSAKVIPGVDPKHFQVEGDLTIRDVTKPTTLDVEYLGMGPIAVEGRNIGVQTGFVATTTVNRKDYGIVWNRTVDQGGVMLGDDVEIVLNIAAFNRDDVPTAQNVPPTPAGKEAKDAKGKGDGKGSVKGKSDK